VYGLTTLAQILHDLGMMLYAGPFVAFTVLIALGRHLPHMQPWDVVRTYRAWGAGLGLAMGAWVLGLLARHYLVSGGFTWGWLNLWQGFTLASHLVFLALWIWNVRVEVWSLEPLRRLDEKGQIADPVAYAAATGRLVRDMAFQSALLIAYIVLEAILTA